MSQVKFFYAETIIELENKVNAYLKDNDITIISISYAINPNSGIMRNCCCIVY